MLTSSASAASTLAFGRARAAWIAEKSESTLPLMYLSRFLYGITLNSFALPPVWIAVRMPPAERPATIAKVMAGLSLAVILGPSVGALLAKLGATDWEGYGMPGYYTMGNSLLQLIIVLLAFDDNKVSSHCDHPSIGSQ